MSVMALLVTLPKLPAQDRTLLYQIAQALTITDVDARAHLEEELMLLLDSTKERHTHTHTHTHTLHNLRPRGWLASILELPPPRPAPLLLPAPAAARPRLTAVPLPDLIEMAAPLSGPFGPDASRHGVAARQRLWIEYEDGYGKPGEHHIDLYHADESPYVWGWCISTRNVRAFLARSIRRWRWLPARYEFQVMVARYVADEGGRDLTVRVPWRRWVQIQSEPGLSASGRPPVPRTGGD